MIVIIKSIFKISEKKHYSKGDRADFGVKENKRLISLGVAELVKVTKERKVIIKKK